MGDMKEYHVWDALGYEAAGNLQKSQLPDFDKRDFLRFLYAGKMMVFMSAISIPF